MRLPWHFDLSAVVLALQLGLSLNQFPMKNQHSCEAALALWLKCGSVSAAAGA